MSILAHTNIATDKEILVPYGRTFDRSWLMVCSRSSMPTRPNISETKPTTTQEHDGGEVLYREISQRYIVKVSGCVRSEVAVIWNSAVH